MLHVIDIDTMPAGLEMDALVAGVMGLNVIGEANCACPEGDWYISSQYPEKDWGHMRPVFLRKCICDRAAECDAIFAKECPDLAEYIFGDHLKDDTVLGHRKGCLGVVSEYSVLIFPAWEVVEKFRTPQSHGIRISIGTVRVNVIIFGEPDAEYGATADTAPLAICRAAWKAKETLNGRKAN